MKRITLLVIAGVLLTSLCLTAQTKKNLKKTLELKMPKTVDDDMCGTRGASVAWHPMLKKYYASFAGNKEYPFGVFDVKGKRLSDDEQKAMVDLRGIWYNPTSKSISGNGYDDNGWFTYSLDKKGIPENFVTDFEGLNQPDAQSVGVLLPAKKAVMFLSGRTVSFYSTSSATSDESLTIHFGKVKKDIEEDADADLYTTPEDYNYTSLIYTGIKNSEIGFLNVTEKQIELYNIADGSLTSVLKLPEDATVESAFNFAYANGVYWLFNIEKRTWIGYK
ncbi:hypothetical protein LK994_05390 [Ferruginibacter lapsinanis]|uniref:hypothetical protein n=1 Tax=Ferruginibacter lapsinanis TaxID=563172 RepID=UPI001E2ACB09|nr:hypothetical protein [Ferruginibacter lapsinanis]UEG50906.1 hypothetical protein LK994_05390 [Ferruginibacter lapsinanis]